FINKRRVHYKIRLYVRNAPSDTYGPLTPEAETVDIAPSIRRAFAKRRCLIPADGFYEWRKTQTPKLPFAIAMKDGRPFTFAGLWEGWKKSRIWGVAANLRDDHERA